MKYKKVTIINAYDSTKNNEENMGVSNKCGCYSCLKIFQARDVKKYIDDTAVCPYCGEQSLIPDASGILLDDDFLNCVNKFWK